MHFGLLCLFQPLPDVFVGVRLVLPASVTDDREELARYFVAYPFVTDCCVRLSVERSKFRADASFVVLWRRCRRKR